MGTIRIQKGSYMTSIPPFIVTFLAAEKGNNLEFKINTKTMQVEVVKEEKSKKIRRDKK